MSVQRKCMLAVFTNPLGKKESSKKMHFKVKCRGESLLLLFVCHCIDYIPIYRYLSTEHGSKLRGKITFFDQSISFI